MKSGQIYMKFPDREVRLQVDDANDWWSKSGSDILDAELITFTEPGGKPVVLKSKFGTVTDLPRSKKRLILTIGLPRAGKTSWARCQGLPIVNPDSVRLALHGQRFLAKMEPFVWPVVFVMAEALFLAGHMEIIVDATNVSAHRRGEWAKKFPDAEVLTKVFDTSPAECKRRALASGQPDLIDVINRMEKDWDLERPESWNKP